MITLCSVEDTEWFGVIFELPDVLVVEYQVISSSLLKGLWQGSADGLDVWEISGGFNITFNDKS